MNPKTRFNILLALLVISSFSLLIYTFVYSQARTIEFLPNNESIDTISKEYDPAINLFEIDCPAANTYLTHYKYCTDDVNIYQPLCPNCCIVGDKTYRAIKCSEYDNTDDYTCDKTKAFYSGSCSKIEPDGKGGDKYCYDFYNSEYKSTAPSWNNTCSSTSSIQTLNHCQSAGCPSTIEPNGTCAYSSGWYCKENYRLPKNQGCTSQSPSTCVSPCGDSYDDYYNITKMVPAKHIGTKDYDWKYVPKSSFLTCMDDCVNAANSRDDCNNKIECCKKNTCSARTPSGFVDNCSDLAVCALRFNNQCDKFYDDCTYWTAEKCAWLTEKFQEALYGGGASSCFKEIDPTFSYRFVAKSSDTMTIIWQIATTPKQQLAGVNLYTKIKVFGLSSTGEIEDPPAHESIVHQKSLNAAFSIYCATAIPKLKQGKAYIIKVYYYIPDITSETEDPIEVAINSMEFILIKIR